MMGPRMICEISRAGAHILSPDVHAKAVLEQAWPVMDVAVGIDFVSQGWETFEKCSADCGRRVDVQGSSVGFVENAFCT